MVGTMIEIPRAALVADEIAKTAQFFSFGTNDLTQTTMGMSRDDSGSFLPNYIELDIIDANPFASVDQSELDISCKSELRTEKPVDETSNLAFVVSMGETLRVLSSVTKLA